MDGTRVIAGVAALIASQVMGLWTYIAVTAGPPGYLVSAVMWTLAFAVGLPAVTVALDSRPRRRTQRR